MARVYFRMHSQDPLLSAVFSSFAALAAREAEKRNLEVDWETDPGGLFLTVEGESTQVGEYLLGLYELISCGFIPFDVCMQVDENEEDERKLLAAAGEAADFIVVT